MIVKRVFSFEDHLFIYLLKNLLCGYIVVVLDTKNAGE